MTAPTPDEAAARCTCDYWGMPGENHKPHCEIEGGPHAECALRIHELEAERDSLRARLAETRALIETQVRLDALRPVYGRALLRKLDGVPAVEAELTGVAVAALGSVEAADTPPSGTSGHEADTPAEADEDTLGTLTGHCCPMMRDQSTLDCEQHHDHPIDCPDVLVLHGPQGPGLPIRDGGSSWVAIRYCPWCATDLCAGEVAGTPAAEPAPDDEAIRKALADAMEEHDVASYRAVRYGEAAARSIVQAGRAHREAYARALVPVVRALAGAGTPTEPARRLLDMDRDAAIEAAQAAARGYELQTGEHGFTEEHANVAAYAALEHLARLPYPVTLGGAPTEPAEVPTCGVVYAGRFWHGAPCRHGRGHEGRHVDVYGRTWTNDADEDAALAEPADDTQETT